MRKYDTIIFDLDGTLLDTLDDLTDSVNFSLALYGFPYRTTAEVRKFVGNGVARLMELAVPGGRDNPVYPSCFDQFSAHYTMNMQKKTKAYDGIMALLGKLRRENYKLAIVSNKFDSGVKALCSAFFGEYIKVAVGESESILRKPAPDAVYKALTELGSVAERAVYVGDSEVDAETAKNAGLHFVGVTWGFRDRAVLEHKGAKIIIDRPDQLMNMLSADKTTTFFNPGCALSIYKPEMENSLLTFLKENIGDVDMHKICCRHDPQLEDGSLIINICAGCDRRFRSLYEGISTISLWEVLDDLDTFSYPDYKGLKMSVHDACPVREKPQVHQAVRSLLRKMNIEVVETEFNGTRSICCGDDFYGKLPIGEVHQQMKKRAQSMPCDAVCVYCVSCVKSLYIGGKKPRHLIDLLMGQTTEVQIYETDDWHDQLQRYIDTH